MSDYFGGDARAAWEGIEPQTGSIRVASGISRTIRVDRPIELTEAQEAEVQRDPDVQQRFHRWKKQKAWVILLYGTFEGGRGSRPYQKAVKRRNQYHTAYGRRAGP